MGLCVRTNSLSPTLTPPAGIGVIGMLPRPELEGGAGVLEGYEDGGFDGGGAAVGGGVFALGRPPPAPASSATDSPTPHAIRRALDGPTSRIRCAGPSTGFA